MWRIPDSAQAVPFTVGVGEPCGALLPQCGVNGNVETTLRKKGVVAMKRMMLVSFMCLLALAVHVPAREKSGKPEPKGATAQTQPPPRDEAMLHAHDAGSGHGHSRDEMHGSNDAGPGLAG